MSAATYRTGWLGRRTRKREAAPAGNVEYRCPGRGVRKSRNVGEHASHVGTPHRPGADHCDTVVLDTGVVHGGHDTLRAPPLGDIGHRGVSAASQGIDAETQWVSSRWSLLCRCRGGVTNVA